MLNIGKGSKVKASGTGGRRYNLGRVIPKTLKIVVTAALLGAQGCEVDIKTDWLVSG